MGKEKDVIDRADTMLNPRGGLMRPSDVTKKNIINPTSVEPEKKGMRFNLSYRTVGIIERLAKSRFEIRRLTDDDVENWEKDSDGFYWELLQSVNASSQIEGEEISAQDLSLMLNENYDEPIGKKDAEAMVEYGVRKMAVKSIYKAYIWALKSENKKIISVDFIKKLHYMMFSSTRPESAGKFKRKEVIISGGEYHIKTLPPEKVDTYLHALCERINKNHKMSKEHADYPMFINIAEFILDFLAIHPFEDGNGRLARLLSTYMLDKCGYCYTRFYPVDTVIMETVYHYYEALFESQKGWYGKKEDLTPWIEYYSETIFDQWLRAYRRVKDKSRREELGKLGEESHDK